MFHSPHNDSPFNKRRSILQRLKYAPLVIGLTIATVGLSAPAQAAAINLGVGDTLDINGGNSPFDVDSLSNTSGTINIAPTGTLNNGDIIYQNDSAQLNNSGAFNNQNLFYNQGNALLNNSNALTNTGALYNDDNATLDNSAFLSNQGSLFNRDDAILRNSTEIENDGLLSNRGIIENESSGYVYNRGEITNKIDFGSEPGGLLTNDGVIYNLSGATLDNQSTLINNNFLKSNSGSTLTNSNMLINTSIVLNQGTLTNSGTIDNQAGGLFVLAQSGGADELGGTIINNGTIFRNASGANNPNGLINFTGDLSGSGIIQAGLVQVSGNLNAGNSPGLMTFDSNVNWMNVNLEMELQGLTRGVSYDSFDILGNLALGAGVILDPDVLVGFTLMSGQIFDLAYVLGGITGVFDVLPTGWAMSTQALIGGNYDGYTALRLAYSGPDIVGVAAAVPEPGIIALFGTGLTGLVLMRRRRRS